MKSRDMIKPYFHLLKTSQDLNKISISFVTIIEYVILKICIQFSKYQFSKHQHDILIIFWL